MSALCGDTSEEASPATGMKMRARRRTYQLRRRKPTRCSIRKKPAKRSSRRAAVAVAATVAAVAKPTYFSLLADVEQALKVEHPEGASLQKLKRDMELKYGMKKFDAASTKMLQSAMKRLRNRGRIAKIHPNSTLFRFTPPVVPSNYNFFGPGSTAAIGQKPISMSRSITPSRSGTASESRTGSRSVSMSGSRSKSRLRLRSGLRSRSMSRSGLGMSSTTSMSSWRSSPSNSSRKPPSRALSVRKPVSSAKRSRAPAPRRR